MKRLIILLFALVAIATGLQAQNIADGHEYVDLGLPSGTLWATCDVGANSPEEYGDDFAWGETQPKNEYSWENYRYCMGDRYTLTKYCQSGGSGYNGFKDTLTELLPEDDAATMNWGLDWQMPSYEQLLEIYDSNYTTIEFTKQDGVSVYKFTSKINDNYIIMPGRRNFCSIWSRSVNPWSNSTAYSMTFDYDYQSWVDDCPRSAGLCVRPVYAPGHIPPHTHYYTPVWSWDEKTHWHACTSTVGYCDAPKAEEAPHQFVVNGICTICGYGVPMLEYNLWIAGTQVTAHNNVDVLGNGKVSYSPSTYTLTLNGANIHATEGYGIQSKISDLKIKLLGHSNIIADNGTGVRIQQGSEAGIATILGGGSLYIKASSVGLRSHLDLYLTDDVKITSESTGDAPGFQGWNASLNMSGTETVLMAKGGKEGSLINYRSLSLNDGIQILQPSGASFAQGIGITKDGAMVANEWVMLASQDYIDGIKPLSNSSLKDENLYNLAGQKVDANYKGIVIKGGKKVLMK